MHVLAIETSQRPASVALAHGDALAEAWLERERGHASDLLPAIEGLRRELGAAPDDAPRCDAIVVGTGPGSYTGLRVGIATALGLARGFGAELRAVPSFDVVAYDELAPGEEGCVTLDARAGAFYFAHYRRTHDDVQALVEPCVLSPAELEARRARVPASARSIGASRPPSAAALLVLGRKRLERDGSHAPERIEPLYLRPFRGACARHTRR